MCVCIKSIYVSKAWFIQLSVNGFSTNFSRLIQKRTSSEEKRRITTKTSQMREWPSIIIEHKKNNNNNSSKMFAWTCPNVRMISFNKKNCCQFNKKNVFKMKAKKR